MMNLSAALTQPAIETLIPTKHSDALNVIGQLGREQVKNRVKMPRKKTQATFDVIEDIWTNHKGRAKRTEAYKN